MFTPVESSKRIISLDVLRGIAVFGILLMNIAGVGLPEPSYGDPTIAGGYQGWNLKVWILQLILSPLWLKYYKMGPLQWMWRWLIYKKQPELTKHPAPVRDS